MGRARVTLKRIINPRCRKLAFVQRKKGLIKKITDFSDKCEVEACLIVYDDGNGDVKPVTWPNDREVVCSIIERYQHQKKETHPKTFNIEEFFDCRKRMVEAEISKLQKEIIKIKYPTWDSSFKDMGEEQLRSFIAMLDSKIGACDHRINMLKNMHHRINIAQESVSTSHPSQFNFMQNNITQSQLINAPIKPLNDNNMMVGLTNSTNVIDGVQNLRINILKSMQQGDTRFSFMPNMVQESAASPNSCQLNCMQNIFQSQSIFAPMEPLNDNFMRVDSTTNSTNLIDGAPNHKSNILTSMRQGDSCFSIIPNMAHEGATSSNPNILKSMRQGDSCFSIIPNMAHEGATSSNPNIPKSMRQGDSCFSIIPNIAYESATSSNPSQHNCVQNISQCQSILAPLKPLIDNKEVDLTKSKNLIDGPHTDKMLMKNMQQGHANSSFMANVVQESAVSSNTNQLNCMQNISQSPQIHATSKSLNDNNEQVSFTNQICESKDLANRVGGVDDLDELLNQFSDDLMDGVGELTESIWQNNIPFQYENEEQGATLQALSPPLDQFPIDYHNMLL